MTLSFVCPDCSAVHQEPLEATFTLSVRCAECALEGELAAFGRRAATVAALPQAA